MAQEDCHALPMPFSALQVQENRIEMEVKVDFSNSFFVFLEHPMPPSEVSTFESPQKTNSGFVLVC